MRPNSGLGWGLGRPSECWPEHPVILAFPSTEGVIGRGGNARQKQLFQGMMVSVFWFRK